MAKQKRKANERKVVVDSEVVRRIRQHARGNLKTEVCGVLIGPRRDDVIVVRECIAGENASQAGTHVTFTQETWEHVYKIKDAKYPDDRIVGWYHSHPGFGVFLSDHDAFIHKNFFSSEDQLAWVFDPHSDEEGCFGWVDQRLERIGLIEVADRRGGEEVQADGRTEQSSVTTSGSQDGSWAQELRLEPADVAPTARKPDLPVAILTHVSAIIIGFLLAWFLFPRVLLLPVPVDPQSGKPLMQGTPGGQDGKP